MMQTQKLEGINVFRAHNRSSRIHVSPFSLAISNADTINLLRIYLEFASNGDLLEYIKKFYL